MGLHADKTRQNKSSVAVANSFSPRKAVNGPEGLFINNRPEAVIARKLKEASNQPHQAGKVDWFQGAGLEISAPVARNQNVAQLVGEGLIWLLKHRGDAGKTLRKMLDVKDLVNLSEVNKEVSQVAQKELYESDATTHEYKTKPHESKKVDSDEFKDLLVPVRSSVNIGYRLLKEILSGHHTSFEYKNYGISEDRWSDFNLKVVAWQKWEAFKMKKPTPEQKKKYKQKNGEPMHPSTSAGYIVEDIASHVLRNWFSIKDRKKSTKKSIKSAPKTTQKPIYEHILDLQDTDIMKGHSRPDITSKSREHEEQMLFDITSIESKGHILDKIKKGKETETDWLRFPHVAEVLYPQINFSDPNQPAPPLSEEDKMIIAQKLIQKQINNDLKLYKSYLSARTKYYSLVFDTLQQVRGRGSRRNQKGKNTWKVPEFTQKQLKEKEWLEIDFDKDGYVIDATVDSFHTTDEGKGLLDLDLFTPPSPEHYSMKPDDSYEYWETEGGKSFFDFYKEYMSLEKAEDHIREKRKRDDHENEENKRRKK